MTANAESSRASSMSCAGRIPGSCGSSPGWASAGSPGPSMLLALGLVVMVLGSAIVSVPVAVLGIGIAVVALVAAYYRPLGFRFSSAVNVRPMLVERMRAYTSTIFAEMSALAAAHRRDQPRAGLPGHRRAALAPRRRRRQHHRRRQPVPAGPRRPGAAHRRGRAPAPLPRPRRRPRRRPDHHRRHRGHRLRGAGAVRAGRRGRRLRAVLRLLRRHHRARGRGAAARPAAAADVRLRPRRAARGLLVAHQARAGQHPAQPDRRGVHRRAAHHDRRAGRRVRGGGRHRRGVRAHALRRAPARADGGPARTWPSAR